jgi:hypothetical protein
MVIYPNPFQDTPKVVLVILTNRRTSRDHTRLAAVWLGIVTFVAIVLAIMVPSPAQTQHTITLDTSQLQARAGYSDTYVPVRVADGGTRLLRLQDPILPSQQISYWENDSSHEVDLSRFIGGWTILFAVLAVAGGLTAAVIVMSEVLS